MDHKTTLQSPLKATLFLAFYCITLLSINRRSDKHFTFMLLPAEIRRNVYKFLFHDSNCSVHVRSLRRERRRRDKNWNVSWMNKQNSIIFVSRQLHNETIHTCRDNATVIVCSLLSSIPSLVLRPMAIDIGASLQNLHLPESQIFAKEIRFMFPSLKTLSMHTRHVLLSPPNWSHENESNADSSFWLQRYEEMLWSHLIVGPSPETWYIRDIWLDPHRTFDFEHQLFIGSGLGTAPHLVRRLKRALTAPKVMLTSRSHLYEETITPLTSVIAVSRAQISLQLAANAVWDASPEVSCSKLQQTVFGLHCWQAR